MVQFNIMKLRHALEARGSRLYSIQEIADHTNLSRDTVSNIVRNKTIVFDIRTFSKLAHYFQNNGLTIKVGDFFRWEAEELVPNIGNLLLQINKPPKPHKMAKSTGIPFSRLKNLIRGNVKRIYLEDLAALLEFFRKREVEIELGDLLREEKSSDHDEDYQARIRADRKRHDLVSNNKQAPFAEGQPNFDSNEFETHRRLPTQPGMLPEVAEVMRMLTELPEPLQKEAAAALKAQLEVIQETVPRPVAPEVEKRLAVLEAGFKKLFPKQYEELQTELAAGC